MNDINNSKIIYFFDDENLAKIFGFALTITHGYVETKDKIIKGNSVIATTQMGLLTTDLLTRGYHIFLMPHDGGGKVIEISNKNLSKHGIYIDLEYNLFEMWKNGIFDW